MHALVIAPQAAGLQVTAGCGHRPIGERAGYEELQDCGSHLRGVKALSPAECPRIERERKLLSMYLSRNGRLVAGRVGVFNRIEGRSALERQEDRRPLPYGRGSEKTWLMDSYRAATVRSCKGAVEGSIFAHLLRERSPGTVAFAARVVWKAGIA